MTDKPNLAPDERAGTAAAVVAPRDAMGLTAGERASLTDDELAVLADMPRIYARISTSSVGSAQRVIAAAEASTPTGKTADWRGAMEELQAASEKLRSNDLSQAEDMLLHQAIGLQALHVRLTEMALRPGVSPHQFDVFMRYGLRAQAQCRSTLEALAEIKNPPILFARQANISNGPQQINNGEHSRVRGRENGSEQIEQSGERPHELPADRRAPALASPTDTPMAPMGTVDGAEDSRGQVAVLPQRMEGR